MERFAAGSGHHVGFPFNCSRPPPQTPTPNSRSSFATSTPSEVPHIPRIDRVWSSKARGAWDGNRGALECRGSHLRTALGQTQGFLKPSLPSSCCGPGLDFPLDSTPGHCCHAVICVQFAHAARLDLLECGRSAPPSRWCFDFTRWEWGSPLPTPHAIPLTPCFGLAGDCPARKQSAHLETGQYNNSLAPLS